MNETVLLTLGRLPKALDIARALHGAGCRVIVAEPFGWHLARTSRSVARAYKVPSPVEDAGAYGRALLDIVAREGVSRIFCVSEEAMHVAALRPALPQGVALFTMDQPTLLDLHDKLDFVRLCQRIGLDVPETYPADAPEAGALLARADCVIKPRRSSAGAGVKRLDQGGIPPAARDDIVLQAFVAGPLVSSFSIAHRGRVIGSVVYRARVLAGTVAVVFERIDMSDAIASWIARFAEATGYTGFVGFDLVLSDDGRPVALECNPRATSGIHFIEPDSLAQALLHPDGATDLRVRSCRLMQQFYPTLIETQAAVLRPRDAWRNLKYLVSARDVTWQIADPLPFTLMTATSAQLLWRAIRERISLGEAATRDIGYYAAVSKDGTR